VGTRPTILERNIPSGLTFPVVRVLYLTKGGGYWHSVTTLTTYVLVFFLWLFERLKEFAPLS